MSAWIESHQALRHHPKTLRLARRLGVTLPAAIGHLHCLWWFALEYAQDGDLSRLDGEEIAIGAGWDGDPAAFIEAAVIAGFLERDGSGLRVHDWHDYAGKLLERRARDRERKAAERQAVSGDRPSDVRGTSDGRPQDGARTEPNRTEPYPTEPYRPTASASSEPVDNSRALRRPDGRGVAEEKAGRPRARRGAKLPELPVTLCGPLRRAGVEPDVALHDGGDANRAARRLLALIRELAGELFGHLSDAERAQALERTEREAFERIARAKPDKFAAYATTVRERATHLGDLVGDELVAELLALGKSPPRRGDAEPVAIGELVTAPPDAEAEG